ncbi:MAG TPA: protein translocase subunit SecD [Candidatus Hydrogenedentes bacterium]|nr:protein translocase subunit SecD [Candidatus Hydrogenedentota bacterium]
MAKNIYRTILIWGVLAMAAYYVYPTIGWMVLSEETRSARLAAWQAEDDQLARKRAGYFERQVNAVKRWAQCDRSRVINLGLDLQGGIHMVLGFDVNDLDPERLKEYRDNNWSDENIEKEIQQTVLDQITRRVNDFEAKEPVIQALGTTQIQIQLPGEKDVQRAKNLITKTAMLNFHIVAGPDAAQDVFGKIRDAFPEEFLPFVKLSALRADALTVAPDNYERVERVLAKAAEAGVIPEDKFVAFSQKPKPYEDVQDYQLFVLDKKPIASGEGLASSAAIPDESNPPYWQILFAFNGAASEQFAEATGNNIGNPMAIVLDGVVVSAPTIRDRIAGRGQISGNFEGEEARDLAIALNSGSMVIPVREEFTRTVSASLGADTVRKGVISSLASLVLVGVFMVFYYQGLGIVALLGLVVNALLIIAAMAYFNLTLTLPGIAGLVLTMGMAVDANVLIYERIREELRLGHTVLASVEAAFKRAGITILDANLTTLIAGAVLMQFGTGPIQGFALTLSIGICTTLFSALVVTPAIVDFMLSKKLITKCRMLALVPANPGIPFMQVRKVVISVSVACIAVGMVWFGTRGMDNFGVDFRQGTNLMLSLKADQQIPVDQVRSALTSAGFTNPVVQETSDEENRPNLFIVRVGDVTRETTAGVEGAPATVRTVAERIQETMVPLTPGKTPGEVVIEDEQTVGPSVGAQLRWDALNALFWALVFIIGYVWVRFELRFALGAVLALVHDLLFTVGVFSLIGGEISMGVIAALLTILGYSINDTIVVFDRVREDMEKSRGKGIKFMSVLNGAINVTLSRTLLTSLTTLFVTVVLAIFGGEAIQDFAVVLTIGILVGTYSSIFIASPIVLLFQNLKLSKALKAESAAQQDRGGRRRRNTGGGATA